MLLPALLLGQQEEWRRMLQATEAEQTVWIKSHLDRGMPIVDPDAGVLSTLTLNRSEITLPLIERKIEDVLRSPSLPDNFTDRSVDPQKFVDLAAAAISYVGNLQALMEARKLIRVDERRFGGMVESTLINARSFRNPFTVAYQGFELGDPAIDKRIVEWAESELADFTINKQKPGPRAPQPRHEVAIQGIRTEWAEAMVDKYGGFPTESQWRSDPIASRLKPAQTESLHDPVIKLAIEVVEKRVKR